MALNSAKSLREKTDQELQDQVKLEKKALFQLSVKGVSGEAVKPHEKGGIRRTIARIQTVLNERANRKANEALVAKYAPGVEGAAPVVKRLVKKIEDKAAAVKAELAKPFGERKPKPLPPRTRLKHLRVENPGPADRAGVRLAEAKRLLTALERLDMGASK
jgi:large subunit ribosomal protein L29